MARLHAAGSLCAAFFAVSFALAPAFARAESGAEEAQPKLSAEQRSEVALASYRAGVAQYSHGRYHDAIALFLEANRLRPSAALSFNIARCYEKLGDDDNALAFYRDYLRRAGEVRDRAQIERRVDKLERELSKRGLQQLTVMTEPDGADVTIDGTRVGTSPWTGSLAPGRHSLAVTLAGYEDATQPFELRNDHASELGLTLQKRIPDPVSAPDDSQAQLARLAWPSVASAPVPAPAPAPALDSRERSATHDPEPERSAALNSVGWIMAGAGGAALGAGLIFELLREGAEHDAQHEPRQIEFAHDLDAIHSRRTAARVLAGAGGLLALTGGVLLVIDASSGERAPNTRVALSCALERCMAALSGSM